MTYESLLQEAHELGLIVKEVNLITKKGRCVGNRIAIDKNIKTDAEKVCILKEEIEHFKTTIGDISDQTKISNIKQEKLARAITIENLCSLEKIVNAYKKGFVTRYELIEHLHITEDFFLEAIDYHKSKHGIFTHCDDVIVQFEPIFGILDINITKAKEF